MRAAGYSLVEVVMAAAIVAIGVGAGAAIMNTLVVQEELNAGAVRAANLQEQAVMLYRLGLTNPQDIYNLLPENCSGSATPAVNTFALSFGAATVRTNNVNLASGGTWGLSYELTPCTVIFATPAAGGQVSYLTNTVDIVRPTIRIGP